jgi:Flp pilus assembly protein TadG
MLEMGLCLIALFFMIFGIVEYSNINYANNFCAYAAQQAVRYASVRGSSSANALPTSPSPCGTSCTNEASGDPTTTYVQGLAVALNTSKLTVTTTWSSTSGNANAAGGTVTVKVSYSYSPLLTLVTATLPTPFVMSSSATMPVIE